MILLLWISKIEIIKSNIIIFILIFRYMTLSSRGITHYIFGIGDFIKIDDWEKEAK